VSIAANAFTSDGDTYVTRLVPKERRTSLDGKKSRLVKESGTRKASVSLNFLSSFDVGDFSVTRGDKSSSSRSTNGDASVATGSIARQPGGGGAGFAGTRKANIVAPQSLATTTGVGGVSGGTSPLKSTIGKIGTKAFTNVSSSLSKFNPVSALHRSMRRAQNPVVGGQRVRFLHVNQFSKKLHLKYSFEPRRETSVKHIMEL
jgi:hypothetical protein